MDKVSRNEPLKPLAGEQLDFFNESIKKMDLKKLKTARQSMAGICRIMKVTDLRGLCKNSVDPIKQEKYKAYLDQVEKYESQVALFDHYIKLKKEGTNEEGTKEGEQNGTSIQREQ